MLCAGNRIWQLRIANQQLLPLSLGRSATGCGIDVNTDKSDLQLLTIGKLCCVIEYPHLVKF